MIGLAVALEVALYISQRRGDGVCWRLWDILQIITFSRLPCPSKKCIFFRLFIILGGMLYRSNVLQFAYLLTFQSFVPAVLVIPLTWMMKAYDFGVRSWQVCTCYRNCTFSLISLIAIYRIITW